MGKPYTYAYDHSKPCYNRHETRLYEADGTKAPDLLITRYTYQYFFKPCKGPRGGRARRQCARSVFYRGGMFFKACNVQPHEGADWLNSYEPYDGAMWDCHQADSRRRGIPIVSIECIEGVPVNVTGEDGETVWQWGDPIAELEDLLRIPESDRAQDQTTETEEQPTETTETEPTETEREELEAARTVWMESNTTEGQQLDLIAYFGYGDASWQDLAAPAA